ncbi:protein kinase domain-containing protein [Candidatus Magnetominusculus dajiuhuensis]|uniref:protein kinase domain-containing protein n=1 Tax=Candidatus Magnetominusculus dajiuhuensis TaxID=3137712 RepID=UPI003B435EA1
MMILTACSNCGAKYNVSDSFIGKPAKCRKCGKTFRIEKFKEPPADYSSGGSTGGVLIDKRGSRDWSIGEVILNLYEITGFLGEGGMGKVYKVRHRGWNVDLAVKSPKPSELARSGGSKGFQAEAETWVNLGLHPHIVSCYYVRELDGIPRVFAEYVNGGNLNDWIHDGKLTELEKIIDVSIQIAWGLQYAHEKGLIHRDIKPANIMITSEGTAKVTDFGLAKVVSDYNGRMVEEDGEKSNPVQSGMTPAFCSPEQANRGALSLKTDVWSWAVSILAMFTGEVTWPSGTVAAEALAYHIDNQAENPHAFLPPIPPQISGLLQSCLNLNPSQRPDSMQVIAETLIGIYQEITSAPYPRLMPQSNSATADSLNNRAVSLLDLGRDEEAEKLWQEAITIQPHHPQSSYNLGLINWRNAKITDDILIRELEEVQRSHSDDWTPQYLLALVHLERSDCISAINYLENIIATYGNIEEAAAALATARDELPASRRLLRTFTGHMATVTSVSLSHDGRIALTGSMDKKLRLWDTATGQCVKTLSGHTGGVLAVSITSDARYAISGSDDKTVRVWNISTGSTLYHFRGHAGDVTSVYLSPDGKYPISGSADETIKLWDINSGNYLRSFAGHRGAVTSVAVTNDGQHVISGSLDGTARIWNVQSLKCLHVFKEQNSPINSSCLSKDGNYFIAACADNTLRLWDFRNRQYQKALYGHAEPVLSVVLSWNSRYALSGGQDKTVRLWDLSSKRCLRTFEGHQTPASFVHMSVNGKYFASNGMGNECMFWDLQSEKESYRAPMMLSLVLKSETAFSAMAAYSSELSLARQSLASLDYVKAAGHIRKARSQKGYSRTVEAIDMWTRLYSVFPHKNLAGGWEAFTFKGHDSAVTSVCIDDANRFILSGSMDKTLRIREVRQSSPALAFKGHFEGVKSVCLSADGSYALSGGLDKTVRLWETAKGRLLKTLKGHEARVNAVCITPDGKLAVSGSDDKTVKVWDLFSGSCLKTFKEHSAPVLAVALSLDNRMLLSAGEDCVIKQCEMTTVEFLGLLGTFSGHSAPVNSVAISLNGRYAVSGSDDKTAKIWDIASGRNIMNLEGHTARVTSVAFTADAQHVISGSFDSTFRIWSTETGQCLRIFKGHVVGVNAVSISMDGRYAISAYDDSTIKVWVLDWDLIVRNEQQWDEGATAILEKFLAAHTPYVQGTLTRRGSTTDWSEGDLEKLIYVLGCAGYGRADSKFIRKELLRLAGKR